MNDIKLLKTAKKLTIDIPEEWYRKIKMMALIRAITMRKYVLQAVMDRVKKEEQYL
jgi:hypothetical protein